MSDLIRILLVDDEPDLADVAATFLEREDDVFEVETATSASTGVERLDAHDFDCIVSDYDMPGLTGIEFLQTVREEYPDLPFILYTGKGSEEVASDAISAGVTDYLQKESGTSQYTVLAHRIRNVVERYRSRRAVEETEETLSQLADRSEDVLFMFDGDWSELLFVSSAFEDIWGIPIDRLEEDPGVFIDYVHPEDRDKARRSMERLSNGRTDEIEYRVVPPDGDQRWVRGQSKPIFDDDGTVTRIVGFVRDITERKERARRFEAIFNNTYTFVGLLEPDGTLIEANDTALSFGGLDRDDVVGTPLWETDWARVSEETRRTIRDGVEHARTGELFRDEIRVQGSDREAVIDFSIRPITDEQGAVTLLVPEGRDITERQKHEQKRQQIIDRVTDAIVEVDAEWTITLVNDQAEELYDMDAEFLLGGDFWDVFDEAVNTQFEAVYRQVMETREPDSLVEHYSGLGGWFDIAVYPEEGGGLAFYFQEVTEHIQQSRELEQTRELLDHTERIADVGGWEVDTGTQEVFWTDNLFELLGGDYDEEPPLEEALDVYVEEDRPLVENAVEEAMSAGEPFDVDARFRHPEGEVRWIQIRGQPTVEDGEVVTLRGAVQDITERKEHERTLERTEARFRALAENFPNGAVHYFDDDLRYQYVAGTGFEPIHMTATDLEGNSIYEVEPYSSEMVDTLESLMQSTLAGNEETIDVDYEDHVFELRSVPIRDIDEEIIGGFFISQDITDRRRREHALERQNERLEQFVSIVSHDLRGPLNVAQGRLELAKAECDSEQLDSVDDALERSQELIDELLTLAREGHNVSDVEAVELGVLAETCWHNVATTEATIERETDRTIRADRSRLQQLLENLYRNAVEHGDDDVTVRVGDLASGFYIEDDGPGIPAEERADVFDAGYSTADEGIGFGLSIVKRVAEGHGWKVSVTASETGGARFEITGVEFDEC